MNEDRVEANSTHAMQYYINYVPNFDQEEWEKVAYHYILEANYPKFTVSEHANELQRKLLALENHEIFELSLDSRKWASAERLLPAAPPADERMKKPWPGVNVLGKALMEMRDRIIREKQDVERNTLMRATIQRELNTNIREGCLNEDRIARLIRHTIKKELEPFREMVKNKATEKVSGKLDNECEEMLQEEMRAMVDEETEKIVQAGLQGRVPAGMLKLKIEDVDMW